jgi:hypothetical protein
MIKAPISLQDLRRSVYVKAKAEPAWRFWGLYVHFCKTETLYEAYQMAKRNGGAPGIDGVTFEAIEESGVEGFLKQIQGGEGVFRALLSIHPCRSGSTLKVQPSLSGEAIPLKHRALSASRHDRAYQPVLGTVSSRVPREKWF